MPRSVHAFALSCLLGSAEAFAPAAAGRAATHQCATSSRHAAPVCLVENDASFSRRAVLAALLGAGIGAGATPAFAGYVTSLGIETTKPEDAERDDDLVNTKEVQASIKNIAAYKSAAQDLKAQFTKNTDMTLIPQIRKDFDFGVVRNDLNTVASVFDDTTQLTIDRLSRSILYDLTELENAARFKKGESETRTPKKIANVEKWFVKLDTDLSTLLKYFG